MISRITISLRKNIRAGEEDDAWIMNDPIVTLPSIGTFNRDGAGAGTAGDGGTGTGIGTGTGTRLGGRGGRGNVEATTWAFGMGGRADGLDEEDEELEGDEELDDDLDVGLESLDSIDSIEDDMVADPALVHTIQRDIPLKNLPVGSTSPPF
jgi:hypothetical protein